MGEADYNALSEEVARTIEVVHGHVIKCESPEPGHNRIARRLATHLENARPPGGRCLSVETDIDVVLWRVPKFTFRRPDVVVHLDAVAMEYRQHRIHRTVLELELPIMVSIPLAALTAP
ncbi:Uma2 family endonuclease [Spongiactinospora sp. 9N601]|uniref:Uma2 family endonuclease n=1 Tax=Spongiactinospora sp. 9N601 TaxID=3375149 RepID=UPI0037A8304C